MPFTDLILHRAWLLWNRWNPDAIVFNSWSVYGTPSYWVQRLFKHSSGAQLLPVTLLDDFSATPAVVSAIRRHDSNTGEKSLIIKVCGLLIRR